MGPERKTCLLLTANASVSSATERGESPLFFPSCFSGVLAFLSACASLHCACSASPAAAAHASPESQTATPCFVSRVAASTSSAITSAAASSAEGIL
eukprot:5525188-Pleurochrysis_carterae.AAC.3